MGKKVSEVWEGRGRSERWLTSRRCAVCGEWIRERDNWREVKGSRYSIVVHRECLDSRAEGDRIRVEA